MSNWVKMKERLPSKDGWYMVRYFDEKDKVCRRAMFFSTNKLSYSDSQWSVSARPCYSWQGALPDEWLCLLGDQDV